jgi:hypothetical protein
VLVALQIGVIVECLVIAEGFEPQGGGGYANFGKATQAGWKACSVRRSTLRRLGSLAQYSSVWMSPADKMLVLWCGTNLLKVGKGLFPPLLGKIDRSSGDVMYLKDDEVLDLQSRCKH